MKIITGFMLTMLLLAACAAPVSAPAETKPAPVPEKYELVLSEGVYEYDTQDRYAAVGYYSDVFSAQILSGPTVEFPYEEDIAFPDGSTIHDRGTPYSLYQARVTGVLKGELKEGEEITLRRLGGYDEETGELVLLQHDCLPQEGGEYLFLTLADDAGRYTVSAPYTVIPLQEDFASINTLEEKDRFENREEALAVYREAAEHPKEFQQLNNQ